jgi:DNA mismatch repair ATPase MutL
MLDISTFIFLSVILVGFGYAAGNAQSFNIWKLLLLGLFIVPFISAFNLSKPHLFTMLGAFLFGYFLPYVHVLQFIGDGLSNLINAIRYRSAYDDIRRKEEEVERLRRKYEEAQREANKAKQDYERERRRQQSEQYRQNQKQQKNNQSSSGSKKQERQSSSGTGKQRQRQNSYSHTHQNSTPPGESTKNKFLRILGLDPDGDYSYADIKKAYRRQASKYHPDKHSGKSESFIKEMNERFKEIKEAYEWLGVYGI